MPNTIVVFSTCATDAEAEKLAHALITANLAACINIVPAVKSIYRWAGKVETASEVLLLIKSTSAAFPALRDFLATEHSYENPEILAISVSEGAEPYLNWVASAVKPYPSL